MFCSTAALRGDDLDLNKGQFGGGRPEPSDFGRLVLKVVGSDFGGVIEGGPSKLAIIGPLRDEISRATRKRIVGALHWLVKNGWLSYEEQVVDSKVVWRSYRLA